MGNCIALCTPKLISTEARGGLSEQPLHPVGDLHPLGTFIPFGDDEKYGRDGQKGKDRSRSSESKEAEDFSSSKPAVSCVVRVKLVIRKQELAEFLSNDLVKTAAMEDLLVELQAKLGDQSTAVYNPYEGNCGTVAKMSSHSGWRPSLESIPEDKNFNN